MPFLNGGVNDARLLFALSPCRYERGCIPTEMTLDCGVSRRSGLRNLLLLKDAEDGTEAEPATVAGRVKMIQHAVVLTRLVFPLGQKGRPKWV